VVIEADPDKAEEFDDMAASFPQFWYDLGRLLISCPVSLT
jgi:hypothetical protein